MINTGTYEDVDIHGIYVEKSESSRELKRRNVSSSSEVTWNKMWAIATTEHTKARHKECVRFIDHGIECVHIYIQIHNAMPFGVVDV